MRKKYQQLNNLTKEQLIYLISQYDHMQCMISETLVDYSKRHITVEKCIDDIRKYLSENNFSFLDEHLDDYINMQLGKISKEEYRKIVLEIEEKNEEEKN